MQRNYFLELIVEFLDSEFYYSAVDNCVFSINDDKYIIGYQKIEDVVKRTFAIDEDVAHAIVFNWLLSNGVKLVKKNWNRTYLVHNNGVINHPASNVSITEDIDFEYKLIVNV